MGRVRIAVEVPRPASAAEALWYDPKRWASFVDGFGHVARISGDWPHVGAEVVWDSPPGGRARVVEKVEAYEPRVGQTLRVEDERMRGVQRVSFEPRPEGCVVGVELDYEIKQRSGFTPLVDLLFVRRPVTESLRRTLRKFAIELASEADTAGRS
jgi:hypothetical protein